LGEYRGLKSPFTTQESTMTKRAICIGINDYPGTQNDLNGCVNDATDWAAALTKRGYAVTKLLNGQATKAAMVGAISDLVGSAAKGDTVVITYSGHGTWVPDTSGDEPDGRDEGLCPWDIGQGKVLLDDELSGLLGHRAAGVRVVLISDSCHSGSVSRGDTSELDAGAPRARFLPPEVWMPAGSVKPDAPTPRKVLGGLSRAGGDLLVAACQDSEYSWDTSFNGRPNGAFTFYALKALATNPDTFAKWMAKITPGYLPSSQLPQKPQLFGAASARRWKTLA
jgi:uncharacterized caspase-like protein